MRGIGIILIIAAVILPCGSLPAEFEILSETTDAITVRQCDGETRILHRNPKRTVICYASLAQVWYCAGGKAVGISQVRSKETLPPEARDLPAAGGTTTPNSEKVLSLKPELVLLNAKYERHHAFQRILDNSGVESILLDYRTYDDFLKLLDLFSRLNGLKVSENETVRKITVAVDALCKRTAEERKVRFAMLFITGNSFSLEPSGMQNALIASRLGGENILPSNASTRQKLSMEALLMADPEVIFMVTPVSREEDRKKVAAPLLNHPAWKQLSAVRNDRVHLLPSELFLFQAGPRFPEAFRMLAELLHPGVDFGKFSEIQPQIIRDTGKNNMQ